MADEKQHGGKREGAGRKPIYNKKMGRRVTLYLTAEQIAYLESVGNGNISAGIRHLIEQIQDSPHGAERK